MVKRRLPDSNMGQHNHSRFKRLKTISVTEDSRHPALTPFYENVITLRQYILKRFPKASQSRKQRLKAIPVWHVKLEEQAFQHPSIRCSSSGPPRATAKISASISGENALSKLLDTTIIGYNAQAASICTEVTPTLPVQNIGQLSQQLRSTVKGSSGHVDVSQSDIVEFAVGHLFNVVYRTARFPLHVLCNGFSRSATENGTSEQWSNGLFCNFSNCNAITLQGAAWSSLLKVLGQDADHVMLDLMFNCSIFVPLETGRNNLSQISGVQLSELPVMKSTVSDTKDKALLTPPVALPKLDKPSLNRLRDIKIVRNRMFYARPGINARGEPKMGLQHIHVFNRYSDNNDPQHVVHVIRHVFPKQFKLHNVFTSKPDKRETTHPQQDYTMREQEIALAERRRQLSRNSKKRSHLHLPKRLRGSVPMLIASILKRHSKCAYMEFLRHHCPNSIQSDNSTSESSGAGANIVDLAVSPTRVAAFCRAVLSRILPYQLFDVSADYSPNFERLLQHMQEFVCSRKRETLDMHSIIQGFKTTTVPWLGPHTTGQVKLAKSDLLKRQELLAELLYYVFDSILIPLIRSNFHVTESNNHTYQLFYFRHDVWRRLTEPFLHNLKLSMFEECKGSKAANKIDLATPHGYMRLVPKGGTFRPIMNLKRKPMLYEKRRTVLGPRSVNMMLRPAYAMLKYEKNHQPTRLGASIFSVDEIYPRIKDFVMHLQKSGRSNQLLYFAKVDVTNCFDTIPQDEVVDIVDELCDQPAYSVLRHAELSARRHDGSIEPSVTKRFRQREPARPLKDQRSFKEYIAGQYGHARSNTIFVEQSAPLPHKRERLMKLLRTHVSSSKVKIGKKFLTQMRGIPQGSILSSILCNFFYGQFEAECLNFIDKSNSLLLRLLDDFLLITLDQDIASRFLRVMHRGSEKYGITIKPQKSLANFPFLYNGFSVARCNASVFPYCGKMINTGTLEISRDRQRQSIDRLSESLTIEKSECPGEAFYRLALDALKRQLHAQFSDATLNSTITILRTIHEDFRWAAMRMLAYIHGLGRSRPAPSLIIKTIQAMIDMTFSILSSSSKLKKDVDYECRVTMVEVHWLAIEAFHAVLGSKQSNYGQVLAWLNDQRVSMRLKNNKQLRMLRLAIGQQVIL